MRPIKLKIRGLNSFNEEQVIDFEKLTAEGLFGIFGPTGSGKSTVLDGITLALYGDISRKSTNYINTNCHTLSVSFEFQISGANVKRYIVEREFKRDKKSGNPISGKCKIMDITSGEPEILADKVKEITSTCKEIIGLSLEDFTRTVVLPQGKFSEFLKLEGKARRDMLERLFNLQQYGDELAIKLKREINKEDTKNSELLGQLKGYEDVREENLKLKEKELKEININLVKANDELKKLESDFKDKDELWSLYKELKNYEETKNKLDNRKEEIEEIKVSIGKGEAASKIMPYIESYEDVLKKLNISKENLSRLRNEYEDLKNKKEDKYVQWSQWREKKDKEIPQYTVRQQQLKEAMEQVVVIEILKKEIGGLLVSTEEFSKREKETTTAIEEIENRLLKGNEIIKITEEEVENLKIDNQLKEKVQSGIILTEKSMDLQSRINFNKNKIITLKKGIKESNIKKEILEKSIREKEDILVKNKEKLQKLLDNCPGTQEDIIKLQKKLVEDKEKFRRDQEANSEIKLINNELDKLRLDKEEYVKEREKRTHELEILKNNFKKLQIETLAVNLRKSLVTGEVCPVCGSKEHYPANLHIVESVDLQGEEHKVNKGEEALKVFDNKIISMEVRAENLKERIKARENDRVDGVVEISLEIIENLERKFENLSKSIGIFTENKEKLEANINKLKEENLAVIGQLNTVISLMHSDENQLYDLSKESIKDIDELEKYNSEIENLKFESGVDDFKKKNKELQEIENKRVISEGKLKKCRILLDDLKTKKDEGQKNLSNIKEALVREKVILEQKEKNKNDKIEVINEKVGKDVNIGEELRKVEGIIKNIELSYKVVNEEKEKVEEEFKLCNDKFIGEVTKSSELEKRRGIEKANVDTLLTEEKFRDVELVKSCFLRKEVIEALKLKVEEYEHEVAKILGTMENIQNKIAGREITENTWLQSKTDKDSKHEEVNKISEVKIKLQGDIELLKKRILELGDLLKKQEVLEHRLALLADLEKLFKGKKFVEFVATHRLKYISMEASKKLKEISSGTYGLETSENGRFIIRDYKNGGVARDSSTLSGGETFLTSLALALSLSAEIQLKGTAPLELFFLDEGFGTLDDNLLEIVMNSLERIHNDKLKIGIISHVESIKNRVPIKLILTPAEAGKGGSKTKIEKS